MNNHDELYPLRRIDPGYDADSVRERYCRLYTGLVSDVLESMGCCDRAMESGVYPLIPTMKVAGPAFTVRCISTASQDPKLHATRLHMLRSMPRGGIQIRSTDGNTNCGHFGEISATAARAAGCAGAVIDGSTRDSNHLIDMGFPTFCRFRNPVEALGRFMAVDYQVPIQVCGVSGPLQVNPGDFLFGDNDGVVVVPAELTLPVLEAAEEWYQREAGSREAMAAGEDAAEVYERYGRF